MTALGNALDQDLRRDGFQPAALLSLAELAREFRSTLDYCVGPPHGDRRPSAGPRKAGAWPIAGLELRRHLRSFECTKHRSVGWIDPRLNLASIIDYSEGIR